MILDLERFIGSERPAWDEFESMLTRFEPGAPPLTVEQTARFHYLYQRCSSDLARMEAFSAGQPTRRYLESLVARGYAEVNARDYKPWRFKPRAWLLGTAPRTFRRHFREFALAVALTVVGAAFGGAAVYFDPGAKAVLMPFHGLMRTPGERVREEETSKTDRLRDAKASFSAELMTHNIRVSVFTLALGITWGIGSVIVIFYNGVMLGAVAGDYIQAGYTPFLLGWLMPHGVIEIPAILVGGQAGFVLASAVIGWGDHRSRRERLRMVATDILNLAGLMAVMLVWAGIIEAFLSQYHEPVIPYSLKIAFGAVELILLSFFFARAGRGSHAS